MDFARSITGSGSVGNQGSLRVPDMSIIAYQQDERVEDFPSEGRMQATDTGKSARVTQLEAHRRSQNEELARLRAALLAALSAKKDGGPKHEECLVEVEVSLEVAPRGGDFLALVGCKSHVFMGEEGALIYTEWVRIMEQTFALGKFTETQKVNYAVRRLGGSALLWWDTVELNLPTNDRIGMTWAEFVGRISKRFGVEGAKKQEDMTKTGSCGACYKVHLGPCIKDDVSCRKCGLSGHFANACKGVEDELNPPVGHVEIFVGKRRREGPSGSSHMKMNSGNTTGNQKVEKRGCSACHKVHPGSCDKKDVRCRRCGEMGHFAKECTKGQIICYNCRGFGHVAAQCPKPKRNVCQRP